ncbi:serine hydrolase [Chryseobacterium daecheongense]|uniref:CubicO group peptidase (Beta-lactamase class C family) n=1 Tax=Chryseobacterium daecheongense TaxID=192389 RepID=A0A3N0W3U9_9FLAO|nr:serine hydrolase [Chryseobacterium daecheongense]ROH99470.1 serine hydrolase [Chryseobacterium daecheongense]TDX95629.1 CubicO group peptidase (beta-lactamase class C family) [Chryseobacterium daecheongense]
MNKLTAREKELKVLEQTKGSEASQLIDVYGRDTLFNKAEKHILVTEALNKGVNGLTRFEIIDDTKLPSTGCTTRILNEPEESSFIYKYISSQETSLRIRRRILCLIAFLILGLNSFALSQTGSKLSDKEIAIWVENYMDFSVKFDNFSGVVLVSHNGKKVFARAYGMANYELQVPNTLNTKFRIGSVSKTFTAAAITKLYQENKIDLDASICKYLDECPAFWEKITIRQLLSHTSGLVSFTGLPEAKGNFLLLEHTSKEIVDLFRAKQLESAPGEKYNYNNSGYYLLGLIVEKVSGVSLEQYLQDNFFIPLQLKNTGVDKKETLIINRASGYHQVNDSLFVNTSNINMDNSFAIGGLYSTANDLLKWANVFDSDVIFKDKIRKEILTKAQNSNYGLGWDLDSIGQNPRFYHDGGITDFSTSLQRIGDFTIIAISNKGSDAGIKVAYDIVGKLFTYPATIRGIQNEMSHKTSDELLQLINKAKQNFPRFRINEKLVNDVADDLMKQEKTKQAIEIYALNTLLYPDSENAYLKLGEAYLSIKNSKEAMKNFDNCLKINPSNAKAREHLRR